MRILIIGGYGQFGSRLASLLKNENGLIVDIAGRSADKAQALCQTLNGAETRFNPLQLDRTGDLAKQIGLTTPDMIVDASGPFQAYGKAPYRVIEYALSIGAHYLDLADGTAFVTGVALFNTRAVDTGVAVISGLSTYPALTSALLNHWQSELKTVTTLRAGISPSPHSNMGRSVIDSVASYAGKPIGGKRSGLTQGFKARICPPGYAPLERLLFADVDVPDSTLLPDMFPNLIEVRNAAGTKPQLLHRVLMGLAYLVKWRMLPSLSFLSPLIHACQKNLSLGAHRSGMMVEVYGLEHNGAETRRSWHLVAEGDDGPTIPSIPAAIVIRKALRGHPPVPGARAATGEVTLRDYQSEFDALAITSGFHNDLTKGSVYERILGSSYNALPTPIQLLHRPNEAEHFTGTAIVKRGKNPFARIVSAIFRFPLSGEDVPVKFDIRVNNGIETWTRNFGERKMISTQEVGTGRYERLMVERFGPFAIGIALVVSEGHLINLTHSWSVLGLPLPKSLMPGGHIYESADDGRFTFNVEIKAPVIGRLVKYQGWLEPAT